MKKSLLVIILALAVIGAAYWVSTMTTTIPEPLPSTNNQNQAPNSNSQATTSFVTSLTPTIKGPVGIMKDIVGEYLSNPLGFTLYININDAKTPGKIISSCNATCEKSWPPFLYVEGQSGLTKTSDPLLSKLNVYKRPDGKFQYALGTNLLYLSAADKEPGKMTAAGSGWMVARP